MRKLHHSKQNPFSLSPVEHQHADDNNHHQKNEQHPGPWHRIDVIEREYKRVQILTLTFTSRAWTLPKKSVINLTGGHQNFIPVKCASNHQVRPQLCYKNIHLVIIAVGIVVKKQPT